jgi:5-methylcytosine-specific restriction protein A
MCDEHQGRPTAPASTVVDHIKPHRGSEALFWDRENLRGMAKPCHDRKTATHDHGFGNA